MVGRQTLEVIRDQGLDLKVQLGIWIGIDETANQAEIARGIALAKEFPSVVVTVSVGNEAMVSWSGHRITVARMLGYIRQVRGAVPQPVTSDDNWALYAGIDGSDPRSIVDAIDYVALHTYPIIDTKYDGIALWDWRRSDASPLVGAQGPRCRSGLSPQDRSRQPARRDWRNGLEGRDCQQRSFPCPSRQPEDVPGSTACVGCRRGTFGAGQDLLVPGV
jgi:hypothetical protein